MTLTSDDRYTKYEALKIDEPYERVLRVTLSNPGRLNSISDSMHGELVQIWRDIDSDPNISVVILTGEGAAFSAGGDFDVVRMVIDSFDDRARIWKESIALVYNLINCSKPVVSSIRGPAAGAGLVCALLADISIVANDAILTDGHTRLGVAAGDHAVLLWPLLCGMAKAKHYLLTCDRLSGEEAERIGLVSLAVDEPELDAKTEEVVMRLASGSQTAIRWTKFALNAWLRQAAPLFESSHGLEMMGFSGPDVREGLAAHLEKRRPEFRKDCPI